MPKDVEDREAVRDHDISQSRMPGCLSGWASAFGSECDPGVPGSSPTSAPCLTSAPSAYVSAFLSLCLSWINKICKKNFFNDFL